MEQLELEEPISQDKLVSPFNIIFSCVICQRTISDVYANSKSAVYDSRVLEVGCKMWMTECTHLTCSEHLENGGTMADQS